MCQGLLYTGEIFIVSCSGRGRRIERNAPTSTMYVYAFNSKWARTMGFLFYPIKAMFGRRRVRGIVVLYIRIKRGSLHWAYAGASSGIQAG